MRPAGKGGEKEEVEEEAASPLQGRESRDVANKPLNMNEDRSYTTHPKSFVPTCRIVRAKIQVPPTRSGS